MSLMAHLNEQPNAPVQQPPDAVCHGDYQGGTLRIPDAS